MRRFVGLTGCLLAPLALGAQLPERSGLGPLTAVIPGQYSMVTGIWELTDGRVMLSDPIANNISIVDRRTGKSAAVKPGSYPHALPITSLHGDSGILVDLTVQRGVLFVGDQVAAALRPDSPAIRDRAAIMGGDESNRILLARPRVGRTDSLDMVLTHLDAQKSENISTLNWDWLSGPSLGALILTEQAFLTRDRWVVVARINPYRVDWRKPDGSWLLGTPVPTDTARMTEAEKKGVMNRLPREKGKSPKSPATVQRWPAVIPIGPMARVFPTSDEMVLIPRAATLAAPGNNYDIVNREGKLVRRLALTTDMKVLGFGKGSIFIWKTSKRRVEQYQWP